MRVLSELDSETAFDGWAGAKDISHYDWRSVAGRYRLIIFEDGASFGDPAANAQRTKKQRRGISEKDLIREQERKGRLSIAEVARCKSRYFVDGAVLGSREWVNKVIEGVKGDYLREDRKMNSSKPTGRLKKSGLWSLRRLAEGG